MTKILMAALICFFIAGTAVWAEDGPVDQAIPKTGQEAKAKSKSGGKQIGHGFKAFGRGVKKIFTGEETKGEFKDSAKGVGEGARDLGEGVLGFGRAAGRGAKKAVTSDPKSE